MVFFTQTDRPAPGSDWKAVWRNHDTDDAVFLHERNARIMVSFGKKCADSHPVDEPCIRCLRRIEEGVAAAKRALDPKASAFVKCVGSRDEVPEYLALVNTNTQQAFVMRVSRVERVIVEKQIFSSVKKHGTFEWPITVVDYTTETQVCDAHYMRAFSIRLGDGLSEEYTRRLWDAKFSLTIDGESMFTEERLQNLLKQKEVELSRPEAGRIVCLFHACALKAGFEVNPATIGSISRSPEADPDKWLGYMLPNGTRIVAELKGVPEGGGLVTIETSLGLTRYTTKAPAPAKP